MYNKLEGGVEVGVSAPGKVILHGEHSVVYGKLAIAGSLGLRTKLHLVEIKEANTLKINFKPLNFNRSFRLEDVKSFLLDESNISNPSDFNLEETDGANVAVVEKMFDDSLKQSNQSILSSLKCVFGLISGMLCSVNVDIQSMSLEVDSELQIGAGSGSSASFAVVLASGFLRYIKLKTQSLPNISKPGFKPFSWQSDDSNFSDRELDIICRWAFLAERIFHGTPSGIDNTVCTYGNIVEFRKGVTPKTIKLNDSLRILLINTRVSRVTSKLVASVKRLNDKFPEVVRHILESMDEVARSAINTLVKIDNTKDDESKRFYHDLGELVSINHGLLNTLGVSHPKLEQIVAILSKYDLKGKLTGAGGGGFALALLPPAFDLTHVTNELLGAGFDVIHTKLGGVGARIDV